MLPAASRLAAAGDLAGVADETMRTMRLAADRAAAGRGRPSWSSACRWPGSPSASAGRRPTPPSVGWALMALALGLVPVHRAVPLPARLLRAGGHPDPVLPADRHLRRPTWCSASGRGRRRSTPRHWSRPAWPWPTRWRTWSASCSRFRRLRRRLPELDGRRPGPALRPAAGRGGPGRRRRRALIAGGSAAVVDSQLVPRARAGRRRGRRGRALPGRRPAAADRRGDRHPRHPAPTPAAADPRRRCRSDRPASTIWPRPAIRTPLLRPASPTIEPATHRRSLRPQPRPGTSENADSDGSGGSRP